MKQNILFSFSALLLASQAYGVTVYQQTFDGDGYLTASTPKLDGTPVGGGSVSADWAAWEAGTAQWSTLGTSAFPGTSGIGERNAFLPFATSIAGTNDVFTLTVAFNGFTRTGGTNSFSSNEKFRLGFSTLGADTSGFGSQGAGWMSISQVGGVLEYTLYTSGNTTFGSVGTTSGTSGIFSIELDTSDVEWAITWSEGTNSLGTTTFDSTGITLDSVGMGIERSSASSSAVQFSADTGSFSVSAVPEPTGAVAGILLASAGLLRRRH